MLRQLVDYARRKELVAEPGFAPKEIRWLVRVSSDGRFTGVIPMGEGKKGQVFARCPDMTPSEKKGGAIRAALGVDGKPSHFLLDTCSVVTLLPEEKRDGADEVDPDDRERHAAFLRFIQLASQEVRLLEPIRIVLANEEALSLLRSELGKAGAKPGDKVSFSVGGQIILDSEDWLEWWRAFRAKAFKSEEASGDGPGSRMLCLATGTLTIPADSHPPLTKLFVGANTSGASFVSFDKPAFESYGLERNANAAVSVEAASAYRASVDSMLVNAPVIGQMKVVVWYDKEIAQEDDPLNWLTSSDEQMELEGMQRARKLLNAIRTGERADLGNSRFYAIAMSGAAGRVMVRDWQTGSLEDFVAAVEAWFSDLSITNARGTKSAKLPGLNRLLMSLQRPKSPEQKLDDYIKPIKMLQIPFWRAALNPIVPIPYGAIAKLMESHRASVMTGEFDESLKAAKPDAASLGRTYARMGLIKAYHNRKGDHRMTPSLDPNHPSKAYHCGRLMCLLARIQEQSSDSEINAGVVQRYYGAASSTPALVLGRLTRLSQHHLSKIAKDSPGLAFWLNAQIAEVWNALGKSLPATLTLEEQSLFALGYYQQFAFNRSKKSGNPEAGEDMADSEEGTQTQAPLF